MPRLLPLAALLLLSGCSSLDLEGRVARAAGDAVGRAVGRAVVDRAARPADGDGLDLAAAEFGTHSVLPERAVPGTRLDTADVAAWAARELGVTLRRTATTPAGADGGVLLRFEQLHDGVPVIGAFYVAEALPGADTVATLAGTVFDDLDDLPRRARVDAAAAARTAGGGDAGLVVLARTHPFVADHTLAWRVRTDRGPESEDVFVNAESGRRIGALPLMTDFRAPPTARDTVPARVTLPTVYASTRSAEGVEVDSATETQFRLSSDRWGFRVGSLFDGEARAVSSAQADQWPDIGWRNGAYDAFWGLEKTHEHMAAAHGWSGLSGAGRTKYRVWLGDLNGTDQPYLGAHYWHAEKSMIFGWLSPEQPMSALSVVGHEFGHAVDDFSAGLTYFGEPGAIDEAIADIRGLAVHRAVHGNDNGWRVAPEVPRSRILNDPKRSERGMPDTYGGDLWLDPEACAALPEDDQADRCGVHINSGVGGFWFYLLADGGQGENDHGDAYDVEGVGFDLAERIVHRAHTRYLGPTSDYADFRRASVRAASDLTGERVGTCDTPTLDAVESAWHAVGVGPPPCRCVEGSFSLSFSGRDGTIDRRMFVRGGAVALEVETSEGTVYSRSRAGGATVTMRGAVDYRGVPTDALYDAAGLPRREYRVTLPRQREPEYDRLEDAWNAARTGRSRAVGRFTAYEYDHARVARGLRAAGLPVQGTPSGTVWTVRDVCLAFIDVTAGPTQITYGAYERRQSWLGFLGLPVEFSSPDGTMRISDLREHPVSDDIIGR